MGMWQPRLPLPHWKIECARMRLSVVARNFEVAIAICIPLRIRLDTEETEEKNV